jgi:uncharacterized protein with HEPN domain
MRNIVQDKQQDIIRLWKALNLIIEIENIADQDINIIVKKLIEIGNLMGGPSGVSYNEKENNCIRNKYGGDDNKNKNRINFEALYHLANVLEANIIPNISDDILTICKDLPNLKKRISNILLQEKEFIKQNFDEQDQEQLLTFLASRKIENANETLSLNQYVSIWYDQLVIDKIIKETSDYNLTQLDFLNKEDRYLVARKLTVIGELYKGFSDVASSGKFKATCEKLGNIRDQIIHNHSNLIVNCSADKVQQLTESLVLFFNSLNKAAIELKTYNNNSQNKEYDVLLENLSVQWRNVYSLLSTKKVNQNAGENLNSTSVKNTSNTLEGQLKGLIKQVALIFQGRKINKSLQELSKQYKEKLISLPSELRNSYPSDLNEDNKERILNIANAVNTVTQNRLVTTQTTKTNKEKQTKAEKAIKRLGQLEKELTYLKETEKTITNKDKKECVIQHVITVIGQYCRDLQDLDTSNEIGKLASKTLADLHINSIQARNKGLAHDIFSFNHENLLTIVVNDILPAKEDINSVLLIKKPKPENTPLSFVVQNNLACSYVRLGYYDEAIKYFNDCISSIKDNPSILDGFKLEQVGLTPDEHFNVIDVDEILFGITSHEFIIYSQLASTYLLKGDYARAKETYILLKERLKSAELSMANKEFRDSIAITIANYANTLIKANKHYDAIELLKYAIDISLNEHDVDSFKFNLLKCYSVTDQPAKVKNTYNGINSQDLSHENQFYYNLYKLNNLYDQNGVSKSSFKLSLDLIAETSHLLEENKGYFKEIYGDRYHLFKSELLNAKFSLVLHAFSNGLIVYKDINQLCAKDIKEFENMVDSLKPDLQKDIQIAQTYPSYISILIYITKPSIGQIEELYKKTILSIGENPDLLARLITGTAITCTNLVEFVLKGEGLFNLADDYLKLANNFQIKAGVDNTTTLFNMGGLYQACAENCYSKSDYIKAAKLYEIAIKKINSISAERINTHELELSKYRLLGISYEGLGDCKRDSKHLVQAIEYYDLFMSCSTGQSADNKEIDGYKQACLNKISQLNNEQIKKKVMIDDVKFKEVEKKVIDQFKKMKLKDKCSDAEMVVKGIVEKDLAKYFKDCLKISNCGIVNEDNELCVSLNKEAIERLRSLAAEVNIEKD